MPFEGIPITIVYKFLDENGQVVTEDMTLPMPNTKDGFIPKVEDVGDHIYDDMNKFCRKGTAYKRAKFILNYSSHRIQLNKLLIADYIEFDLSDFILPFTNKQFKLNSDRVKKNWMSNMVVSASGSNYQETDPVPAGAISLEFISVGLYTSDENNNGILN